MNAKRLVAHRGDNTNHPENSIAGIKSALEAGALYIEFDIQMNADKSLVVIHDTDFKRTAGVEGLLFESTNLNLESISVHEPKKFEERHYPTKIPYLSDILNLLEGYPNAHAFVEIKIESLDYWGLSTVMDKLLDNLKPYHAQTTVISYSQEALLYVHTHSQLQTGLVFNNYNNETKDIAIKLKPNYLISPDLMNQENNLWKGNWKWIFYSVNNVKKMRKVLKMDFLEMIETDDILLMLQP